MPAPRTRHLHLTVLLLASLLSACGPRAAAPDPAARTAAPAAASGAGAGASAPAPASATSAPPVSVTLVPATARNFTIALDASGTVASLSSVDVKPQVSAQVLAVHVKEGQFVQRGQALFTLDARIDQANLKKAEAQLQKDEASLADAKRQLARSQDLLRQNFVSQGAVDTSLANVDGQQAVVAADQAAIDAVKAQLSYSRISAPGAGRVGPIAVFVGSSVSPTGAAMLNITQIDPVAVAFNLPQRNLPDALKALASGSGVVTALLPDSPAAGPGGASAPGLRKGKLSFVDSAVDGASGTVKVKAVFANKDQALWPGAYVTVKMALQNLPDAIVVPQAAIVQGARGTSVFVAGPGNVAAIRPVKVLAAAGPEAVVSGLRAGERVVLDGRQNVRPGSPLIERPAEPGRGAAGVGGAGPASGAASNGVRAP
jgi:RND family efflux transporter MFP subunit